MKMVPGAGLEPARPLRRGILNPVCLPIPPPGHDTYKVWGKTFFIVEIGSLLILSLLKSL